MFTSSPISYGRIASVRAVRSLSGGLCLILCGLPTLAEPSWHEPAATWPQPLWPNADRSYDPVSHALTLGLTPEIMDAAFDRRLLGAEMCSAGAEALASGGCGPVTPVEKLLPTS